METIDVQTLRFSEAELTEDILTELIRLSEAWERENSCHGYRRNDKTDLEGNRVFLACAGDAVVGYLFGHVERSKHASSVMPDGTAFCEIEELYVRPFLRGKGVGKRLFEYAEQALRAEAEFLMLSTATKNWRAILHFYIDELDMRFWSARLYKPLAPEPKRERKM